MTKEYVNFPVKLDNELHKAIKQCAFLSNLSIQQLLYQTLRDKFVHSDRDTVKSEVNV